MDDIIFLIIAVAISIFAAINKSKKKQMEGQFVEEEVEEEDSNRRRKFMDQLLGENFLEDEEPEWETQPERAKPAPSKVVFKSSDETRKGLNYQLPRFKSTLPDRPKRAIITTTRWQNEVEEPTFELEEGPSYLEDFSLRKAIVYSQIIERKPEWDS